MCSLADRNIFSVALKLSPGQGLLLYWVELPVSSCVGVGWRGGGSVSESCLQPWIQIAIFKVILRKLLIAEMLKKVCMEVGL